MVVASLLDKRKTAPVLTNPSGGRVGRYARAHASVRAQRFSVSKFLTTALIWVLGAFCATAISEFLSPQQIRMSGIRVAGARSC
jgi:hypothetical protein